MSRGVYYVKNHELATFMTQVDSDFTLIVAPYRWVYTKSGTARDALVSEWLVILQ